MLVNTTNKQKTTQWVGKIWWMWRNMERYFYNQTEWSLFSNKVWTVTSLRWQTFPYNTAQQSSLVWCPSKNTHMFASWKNVLSLFRLKQLAVVFLHIATQYSAKLRKQNNITNYKWKKMQSTLHNTPQLSLISNANTVKNTKVVGKKRRWIEWKLTWKQKKV